MAVARAGTLGATRVCPHCKAVVLQSESVCPGCRHHLRFNSGKGAEPEDGAEGGCVDGNTQYVSSGTGWQRASVPDDHNFVTVSRFDPATGTLRVQRWLPDIDTMAKARALGGGVIKGCGGDSALLGKIAGLRDDLAALLPAQPNERIVYHCQKGRLTPGEG